MWWNDSHKFANSRKMRKIRIHLPLSEQLWRTINGSFHWHCPSVVAFTGKGRRQGRRRWSWIAYWARFQYSAKGKCQPNRTNDGHVFAQRKTPTHIARRYLYFHLIFIKCVHVSVFRGRYVDFPWLSGPELDLCHSRHHSRAIEWISIWRHEWISDEDHFILKRVSFPHEIERHSKWFQSSLPIDKK